MLADFGTGQVFWSMLWFFLFFIWIWMLIAVFSDIFRSPDLSGWGKALWSIFIIVVPYLGVFVYLIARGHRMHEHALQAAADQEQAFRGYVKDVTASLEMGNIGPGAVWLLLSIPLISKLLALFGRPATEGPMPV
jgi:hypothetical protein